MATSRLVRRLRPGDEGVLATLAREDAEFDLADRDGPRPSLGPADAAAYLSDPDVLHWVVEEAGAVVGHLLCLVQRRRSGDARELLLYDIGVRSTHRRRGVGRLLVGAMDAWMTEQAVSEVWVLADNPGAEAFYRACGFEVDESRPVSMSRRRPAAAPDQ
jgi:ribosomal protein S18 acetylase RimI-like enzyme